MKASKRGLRLSEKPLARPLVGPGGARVRLGFVAPAGRSAGGKLGPRGPVRRGMRPYTHDAVPRDMKRSAPLAYDCRDAK